MSVLAAHRAGDPDDVENLNGAWHIGRSYPGAFPWIEQQCECPKAPCGLVIPDAASYCHEHAGSQPIRQAHTHDECADYMRATRRRRR